MNNTNTKPAVTDQLCEFDVVVCEDCGGDTFHIGIFDGQLLYQCVTCSPKPKIDSTIH
jgi:DNA-directed RNA polymerase subunit RPC12/RpoP